MNQGILFNDDHFFNKTLGAWCFTGIVAGQVVNITIYSDLCDNEELSANTKFDWEMLVEDWLDQNEPEDLQITFRL